MTDDLQSSSTMPTEEDWSHVRETVTMLYLAVCQIKSSINESNVSVDQLTHSFTELAIHTREVDEHIETLSDQDSLGDFKAKVSATAKEMQSKTNQAITAFQFYDRISQRLDHVAGSLEKTCDLMSNPQDLHNPLAWQGIQEHVKNSYTMEAERLMFEHIMRGSTVKEALEIYHHHFDSSDKIVEDDTDDEIELF